MLSKNKIKVGMKPLLFHLLSHAWSMYVAQCNPSTCTIMLDAGLGRGDSRPGTCSYGLQVQDYECLGMKSGGDGLDYALRLLQDERVRPHSAERKKAIRENREKASLHSDDDYDPSDDDDDDEDIDGDEDDDDEVKEADDDASSKASSLFDEEHDSENEDHNRVSHNGEDTEGEDTRYGIEVFMLTILFLICCCT